MTILGKLDQLSPDTYNYLQLQNMFKIMMDKGEKELKRLGFGLMGSPSLTPLLSYTT